MKKSIISLLLSISMTVGSIGAVPAFAAEAVEEETASSTGLAEEAVEEAADTASDEAGTSSTLVTSEAAKEIEEVSDAASTSSTSEVAKEIEEVSDEAGTSGTSEVAKEIEEVPDEAASAAGEVTEASAEPKAASGSTFKPGDKMIALGEEGTTQQFPMNPERTNGFDDYRVDISSYDIWVDEMTENGMTIINDHHTISTSGEYKKLRLQAMFPVSDHSWGEVLEDKNVIRYEIQGPNVKKVLREKAHDEEVFFGYGMGCLSEPVGISEFAFDAVNSERIGKRLKLPDNGVEIGLHYFIYNGLQNYDLDELRKYDSARDFVEATDFMQSDSIYKECVGRERDYKGSDIVAIAKERAEEYAANGYERTIETMYANCIGIKEGSKWMDAFRKKYDEGEFSFCVKEGDTYWFAMWASYSLDNTKYGCNTQVQYFINNFFPGMKESEYEVRTAAAFDEWEYYIYFDFTVKDVCDAWLAEMDNWEGHWNYFLYGYFDEEEDVEWPGYYQNNWFSPGTTYGKTTLHYPDQYDYYVKDPGVYTVTATIDGCNGIITDQFVVKEEPAQTGWVKDENGWKYIEENGQPAKNKWIEELSDRYYVKDDGYRTTGLQKIDNAWYYFDSDGVMQTDWQTIGDARYYFDTNGIMQRGWHQIANFWYFFNSKGVMQIGLQKIDNVWYYFDADGVMQIYWQTIGNARYYFDYKGVMQTGLQKIDNVWYYFNADGVMQTGWQKIGSAWYYFNADGVMQTGWQKIGSAWYYFNADGVMQTGLQVIDSVSYYFNADGVMQTGLQKIDNVWYYFDADGVMQSGWQKIGSASYYFNADGVMQTGWKKIINFWYYFNADGVMQRGWQKIGNFWYYFNANGMMQTGWQKINNKWYYMSSGGAMQTGWQKINNKWYYFSAGGAMQTGWQKINNRWYYFSAGGAMQTGWQKINNTWYYFRSGGAMVTGRQQIDGKWYTFSSGGALQ